MFILSLNGNSVCKKYFMRIYEVFFYFEFYYLNCMDGLFTSDPDIFGGKPILRGTRITVEFLLKLLKAHIPTQEILEDYPSITKDLLEEYLNLSN